MSIRIKCRNGHTLKVSASLAGRQVRCPECKTALRIPELPADDPVEIAEYVPPPPRKRKKKAPSKPPAKVNKARSKKKPAAPKSPPNTDTNDGDRRNLIIAAIAGSALALTGVVCASLLWPQQPTAATPLPTKPAAADAATTDSAAGIRDAVSPVADADESALDTDSGHAATANEPSVTANVADAEVVASVEDLPPPDAPALTGTLELPPEVFVGRSTQISIDCPDEQTIVGLSAGPSSASVNGKSLVWTPEWQDVGEHQLMIRFSSGIQSRDQLLKCRVSAPRLPVTFVPSNGVLNADGREALVWSQKAGALAIVDLTDRMVSKETSLPGSIIAAALTSENVVVLAGADNAKAGNVLSVLSRVDLSVQKLQRLGRPVSSMSLLNTGLLVLKATRTPEALLTTDLQTSPLSEFLDGAAGPGGATEVLEGGNVRIGELIIGSDASVKGMRRPPFLVSLIPSASQPMQPKPNGELRLSVARHDDRSARDAPAYSALAFAGLNINRPQPVTVPFAISDLDERNMQHKLLQQAGSGVALTSHGAYVLDIVKLTEIARAKIELLPRPVLRPGPAQGLIVRTTDSSVIANSKKPFRFSVEGGTPPYSWKAAIGRISPVLEAVSVNDKGEMRVKAEAIEQHVQKMSGGMAIQWANEALSQYADRSVDDYIKEAQQLYRRLLQHRFREFPLVVPISITVTDSNGQVGQFLQYAIVEVSKRVVAPHWKLAKAKPPAPVRQGRAIAAAQVMQASLPLLLDDDFGPQQFSESLLKVHLATREAAVSPIVRNMNRYGNKPADPVALVVANLLRRRMSGTPRDSFTLRGMWETIDKGPIDATFDGQALRSGGTSVPIMSLTEEAAIKLYKEVMTTASQPPLPNGSESRDVPSDVGSAMQKFVSEYGFYPPQAIVDSNGKPLLSWRVAILPELGYPDLFALFHLNEPWDGPHNLKLLDLMPPQYHTHPQPLPAGITGVLALVGEDTAFPPDRLCFRDQIRRNVGDVIVAVELGSRRTVEWTKPEDLLLSDDELEFENLTGEIAGAKSSDEQTMGERRSTRPLPHVQNRAFRINAIGNRRQLTPHTTLQKLRERSTISDTE